MKTRVAVWSGAVLALVLVAGVAVGGWWRQRPRPGNAAEPSGGPVDSAPEVDPRAVGHSAFAESRSAGGASYLDEGRPDWVPSELPAWQPAEMSQELRLPRQLSCGRQALPGEVIAGMVPSRGGDSLYVLDASNREVLQLDVETFSIRRQLSLLGTPVDLALTPDGHGLFVVARTTDISGQRGGMLYSLSADLAVEARARIQREPFAVAASDYAAFVSATYGQGLDVFARGSLRRVTSLSGQPVHVRMHPDQSRLYVDGGGIVGVRMRWRRDWPEKELETYGYGRSTKAPSGTGGGYLRITPDGELLFASAGSVFRLSPTPETDLTYLQTFPKFLDVAFAAGLATFFVGDSDGRLLAYDRNDLSEPRRVYPVGRHAPHMVLDARRKRLYAVLENGGDQYRSMYRTATPGRLCEFDLSHGSWF